MGNSRLVGLIVDITLLLKYTFYIFIVFIVSLGFNGVFDFNFGNDTKFREKCRGFGEVINALGSILREIS